VLSGGSPALEKAETIQLLYLLCFLTMVGQKPLLSRSVNELVQKTIGIYKQMLAKPCL
jgi:hypothetical protein